MPTPAPSPTSSAAFRDELAALVPSLRARAARLGASRADAADLVQDAVERALRFEASFQPGTNLRAWAHQVLFSVFVTRCRKLRRERRALAALHDDPCAWVRTDAAPSLSALTPPVAGALDALPAAYRAVVRLVDLEERSYKDAAAALGIPVGTVMSRLYRGRRLLAARLASSPERVPEAA